MSGKNVKVIGSNIVKVKLRKYKDNTFKKYERRPTREDGKKKS